MPGEPHRVLLGGDEQLGAHAFRRRPEAREVSRLVGVMIGEGHEPARRGSRSREEAHESLRLGDSRERQDGSPREGTQGVTLARPHVLEGLGLQAGVHDRRAAPVRANRGRDCGRIEGLVGAAEHQEVRAAEGPGGLAEHSARQQPVPPRIAPVEADDVDVDAKPPLLEAVVQEKHLRVEPLNRQPAPDRPILCHHHRNPGKSAGQEDRLVSALLRRRQHRRPVRDDDCPGWPAPRAAVASTDDGDASSAPLAVPGDPLHHGGLARASDRQVAHRNDGPWQPRAFEQARSPGGLPYEEAQSVHAGCRDQKGRPVARQAPSPAAREVGPDRRVESPGEHPAVV